MERKIDKERGRKRMKERERGERNRKGDMYTSPFPFPLPGLLKSNNKSWMRDCL